MGARLEPPQLTDREGQCLRLVYERRTTKEIARETGLSPGTVYRYLHDAQKKLGARNRREAAELQHFFENGPIKPEPNSDWIETSPTQALPSASPARLGWRRLLPFRLAGEVRNELSPFVRVFWIVAAAFAIVVALTLLAAAIGTASDVYLAWRRR